MPQKIAVVGFECKYPDAENAQQLWENVLAKRRAFRNMPTQRLNDAYFSNDQLSSDQVYTNKVAVLKNYLFDRAKYKISTSNYNTADLTHWLALEVAAEALKAASLNALPEKIREKTGVIIGNTLTGEFSRSNLLRLRWPYISNSIASALMEEGWDLDHLSSFLSEFEKKYKDPFPKMEEDSLAGGLSNTIAGRICNYFDFKGGGYTIDGACSSSLLAISKACDSIVNKELLIAVVGGVDLSLDPFELVGFSRAGALAKKEMMVYDKNANGFWPGEGCGFVVLADYELARDLKLNIHASITGWGISSDGKGGLTRPSIEGQYLALERAYQKAGYNISTISYLEGHGTGTSFGDATELSAIIRALESNPPTNAVNIGSIKANIGHTKAASGVAGLIKCLMVLKNRIIPPATGVQEQNILFDNTSHLKLPSNSISYKDGENVMRVGVSSMGFGGINTHITLEENISSILKLDSEKNKKLDASYQDSELFLLAERNIEILQKKLGQVLQKAKQMSKAELTDLSCTFYEQLQNFSCRLAIEASTPEQLVRKISKVIEAINISGDTIIDCEDGIYFSTKKVPFRIGFLFPGQGNEAMDSRGLLHNRFSFIQSLTPSYLKNEFDKKSVFNTSISQPAILCTSILAIKFLKKLGVQANVALGHSLGELSALYWANVLKEEDIIELAKERGTLMHEELVVKGRMLSVSINYDDSIIGKFANEFDVSLACVNGATQVVFSGSAENINELSSKCKLLKIPATLLQVENAFHSKLMKAIEHPFSNCLYGTTINAPQRKVYSTVSADVITTNHDVSNNLLNQLTHPVLFHQTFERACRDADLWIEVGPGNTLAKLVSAYPNTKCISLDFTGKTIKGILNIAAAMFVSDNAINSELIFENRFYRKFQLEEDFSFIENPCEKGLPLIDLAGNIQKKIKPKLISVEGDFKTGDLESLFKLELAKILDLPGNVLSPNTRMLDDLHLNSLYVGQLLADFATKYGLNLTDTPNEFANASIEEIVRMFEILQKSPLDPKRNSKTVKNEVEGLSSWVFPFEIKYRESLLPTRPVTKMKKCSINQMVGRVPNHVSRIRECEFVNGAGVLFVFLFCKTEEEIFKVLNEFVKLYRDLQNIFHITFIQDKPVIGGFAKSLFLEHQNINVLVVEISLEELTEDILQRELFNLEGFVYAKYDKGIRNNQELQPMVSFKPLDSIMPKKGDSILVTGGAKGITFECVRELAIQSNCRLLIIGRSDPEDDKLLSQNLMALKRQGVNHKYYKANIGDPKQLSKVIKDVIEENANIVGIIHGAGVNNPAKVGVLMDEQLYDALAPKLYGLRNLFHELDSRRLKFCITFGSIIAESGMEGNAAYALANEWQRNEVDLLSTKFGETYFLNIEWSVWGGTGMGQNLGALEHLKKKGIHPITLDDGIKQFIKLFNYPIPQVNVLISGRHGKIPTLRKAMGTRKPMFRFIEDIKLHYPEIELVAECTLCEDTDLYLKDHMPGGQIIFPAVFGLEAMTQAVFMLTDEKFELLTFEKVEFKEPIIIPKGRSKVIRIIAQRLSSESFLVVVREESTGFKRDHFKAHINVGGVEFKESSAFLKPETINTSFSNIRDELYRSLLFHGEMYQKIVNYNYLDSYSCEIFSAVSQHEKYYSDFLPQKNILGNPILNDTALHCIQACVPNYTLLPVSIEKLSINLDNDYTDRIIQAYETKYLNDEYHYNINITGINSNIISSWVGVKFKVFKDPVVRSLSPFFLQLVFQRKLDFLADGKRVGNLHFNKVYNNAEILKRADGKPQLLNGNHLTKSYCQNEATLVESECDISIDKEAIVTKSNEHWKILLGQNKFELSKIICNSVAEDQSSAATRVWCASECLRKAGIEAASALVFSHHENDSTVYLTSGYNTIITYKFISNLNDYEQILSLLFKGN